MLKFFFTLFKFFFNLFELHFQDLYPYLYFSQKSIQIYYSRMMLLKYNFFFILANSLEGDKSDLRQPLVNCQQV